MEPLNPAVNKRRSLRLQPASTPASTPASEASSKRGRREPAFSDHISNQNWPSVKQIFEKSTVKQQILYLKEIADNPKLSQSTIQGLTGALAPFDIGTFINDYKKDPYSALFKHLGNCYESINQLEVETFYQKINQANYAIKFSPDTKQFAHVFSDFILEGSPLQGMSQLDAIHCLHRSLEIVNAIDPQWARNPHLQGALSHINTLEKEAVVMEKAGKNFTEESLSNWAKATILKLRKAGNLCLPSGWKGLPAGHFMIAAIRKTGSTYSLSLYNTGGGLDYHKPMRVIDGKMKFLPVCTWEKIPAEEMESEILFKVLFGMKISHVTHPTKKIGEHHLYFSLKTILGEPALQKDIPDHAFITPQRAGTCSWKCLMAFLKSSMPEREYLRLKLQIKLVVFALTDTSALMQENFRSLYQPTFEKIFRSIDKLYVKGIITTEEMFKAFLVFKNKPTPPIESPSLLPPAAWSVRYALELPKQTSSLALLPTNPPLFEMDQTPLAIAQLWDTKEKTLEGLIACRQHIQKLYDSQRLEECHLVYDEYLLKLPQISSPFWQLLNVEEISECSNSMLFFARMDRLLEKESTPEMIFNRLFLYQVQHLLVERGLKCCTGGIDIFEGLQFSFDEMGSAYSIPLTSPDPIMIERVKLLKQFFVNPKIKERAFFWSENTMDLPEMDFDLENDTKILPFIKRYLAAVGKENEIPQLFTNYMDIIEKKEHLPPLFWNLWKHFWFGICNAPLTDNEWKVYSDNDNDDEVAYCKIEFGTDMTSVTCEWLDKANDPEMPLGFHFQIPYALDVLIKNTGLLTKKEWNDLTRALFQKKLQDAPDAIPFLHELTQESCLLTLEKLYALLRRQIELILLNHHVDEIGFFDKLILTIGAYLHRNSPELVNRFLLLLTLEQMTALYDAVPKNQKLQAGLTYLSFCHSRNLEGRKWCEVYIETLFRSVSDLDRTDYVKCRSFGRFKKEALKAAFESLPIHDKKRLLNSLGLSGAIIGVWPQLKVGSIAIDLERGTRTDESGIALLQLDEPSEKLKGLSAAASAADYPIIFKQMANRLEHSGLGISLAYFTTESPIVVVSADRLEKIVGRPLTLKSNSGYAFGKEINRSILTDITPLKAYLDASRKEEEPEIWFANDQTHAYINDKRLNTFYRLSKEGNDFVFVEEPTGFYYVAKENHKAIMSACFQPVLARWAMTSRVLLWHNPATNEIIHLDREYNLHFIWKPANNEITIKEFPGFTVCKNHLIYNSLSDGLLLENKEDDLILLLPRNIYKIDKSYIVLKRDKEVKQLERCFTGTPSDMMQFIRSLMQTRMFELAHFYYIKTPKLLKDDETWKLIHKNLTKYDEIFKNSKEPNLYGLLAAMAFDLSESQWHPQQPKNKPPIFDLYSKYMDLYSNLSPKLRLSIQQEEHLCGLFSESQQCQSHLHKVKNVEPHSLTIWNNQRILTGDRVIDEKELAFIGKLKSRNELVYKGIKNLYFPEAALTEVFLGIAKEIVEGIATQNIAVKHLGLAKLAFSTMQKENPNNELSSALSKVVLGDLEAVDFLIPKKGALFYAFMTKIIQAAKNPEVAKKLHAASKKEDKFKEKLLEAYASLNHLKPIEMETSTPDVEKNDLPMEEAAPFVNTGTLPRYRPFNALYEQYFTHEEIPLTINELAASASEQVDMIGSILLRTINEHSKLPPSARVSIKEGTEGLLRMRLAELEIHYKEAASAELKHYKSLAEASFEKVNSPDDFKQALLLSMRRMGGKQKETTLLEVLERYLNNQLAKESIEIRTSVEKMLLLELHALVCKHALNALDKQNVALASQILLTQMPNLHGESALITRVYMFYQIVSGKLLREKQWDVLDCAALKEKAALQIDCGEGKTKVLTTVLAMIKMLEKGLVFNIVPQGNAETNVSDLIQFMGEKTRNRVTFLEINRSFNATLKQLERLENRFKRNMEDGVLSVAIPQTMQSLLLKYFEVLLEAVPESQIELHDERLIVFERILSLILVKSRVIIDEGHEILAPNRTLNFSLQDEDEGLDPKRFNDMIMLFRGMDAAAEGIVFPIGSNHQASWTQEHYHATQKASLAYYLAQLFPKEEQDAVALVLLADKDQITQDDKDYFYSKDPETQDRILLLRAQLHYYLPYTLNLRCSVNYGPLEGVKEAVPYQYNQCASKNSKFQNPDILTNLSIQQTLQLGLTPEQMKELLAIWQRSGQVYQEIQEKCPLNLMAINLENNEMVNRVHAALNEDSFVKLEYARLCILPEIKLQTKRLSSNAQDLGAILFPQIMTFSGTLLSNFLTLPLGMHFDLDGKVDADMLRTFLFSDHVSIASDSSLKALLTGPHVCMVLDPNAHFEGMRNKVVAKLILEVAPEDVKAVDYFDEETNLLTRIKKDSAEGRVITYCDQKHTTGTDTIQPQNGVAVLIVNKGMSWTDLVQAAKRMRQLGKGQKVTLAIAPLIHKMILEKVPDQELKKETVLLWSLLNEAGLLGSCFMLSLQQQVHTVFRRPLIKKLIGIASEPSHYEKRKQLLEAYSPLIVENVNNHEYREHGSIEPSLKPYPQLLKMAEQYSLDFPHLLQPSDQEELKAILHFASIVLSHSETERVNDRLSMHMQTEKREVRLLSEELEDEALNRIPFIRKVEPLLTNDDLSVRKFLCNHPGMPDLIYFNSGCNQEIGLDDRLMFTSKLLFRTISGKNEEEWADVFQKHQFTLYLPKISYVLGITARNQTRFYTIIPTEAETIRKFAYEKAYEVNYLTELRIFNAEGEQWLHYRRSSGQSLVEPLLDRIISQVKFLNADMFYSQAQRAALQQWLREGNKAQKVAFFWQRQKQLSQNDPGLRHRDPEIMNQLFNEKVHAAATPFMDGMD